MRRPRLPALLAVATLLAGAAAARAEPVEVRAGLEPEALAPGQVAFFWIEVTGGVFDRVRFDPHFELVNLEQVESRPSTSNSVRWINGATTRSVRVTWRLRAGELGPAAVRDISVRVGGQRFDLPARTAQVVSDPPPSQRRRAPGSQQPPGRLHLPDVMQDFFDRRDRPEPEARPEVRLVAEATPRRPWAGQQVTYTLWLYTQTNIARVNLKEMPEFRGFWVEEVERRPETRAEPVEIGGERFWRTPILQRALFPRRPGRYALDPAEVQLVARTAPVNPFSVGLPRAEQLVRRSEPVVLDVRPLPAVPPDLEDRWSGLVGNLSLDARLVPSELAVGDASTLELTLAGRGNVEGLEPPTPRLPEGVRGMPPDVTGGNRLEGSRVEASRTWSYPLVPDRTGTWRLPPVELAYFDPTAGEYRLAASPALLLRARRGELLSAAGGPSLHPVKNAALPSEERGGWRRSLPWLFGLPWLLVLVTALVRWRREANGSGDEAVERFLGRLHRPDDADERPRHAAIALEAAWRDFLANRFDVSPELPPSRWRQELQRHGTGARLAADLDDLVEDLRYLRHAPQLSTVHELSGELRERSHHLGRKLAGA